MKKGKRKRTQVGRRVRSRSARRREAETDQGPSREKILRGRANEGTAPNAPSRSELKEEVRDGRVVSIRGSEAAVEPEGGGDPVLCILRKSTRVPDPGTNALVVGDFVRFARGRKPPFVLTEVLPRQTRLSRIRRGEEQVLCANVDLGVIVASVDQPPFKPRLVDRYLVSMRPGGLEPVLVLNKADLLPAGGSAALLAPYRPLGFPLVATSAETGEGLEELRGILRGHTAVFSGQSGVGKSSLLNRLAPELGLRTEEVYGRVGKGRHTTSSSTLYRFPFGGAVVDTPGIRSFVPPPVDATAILEFFPEVAVAAEGCRYSDCAHRGDEGCAVPAAVASGSVHADRLDSFLVLMEEAHRR